MDEEFTHVAAVVDRGTAVFVNRDIGVYEIQAIRHDPDKCLFEVKVAVTYGFNLSASKDDAGFKPLNLFVLTAESPVYDLDALHIEPIVSKGEPSSFGELLGGTSNDDEPVGVCAYTSVGKVRTYDDRILWTGKLTSCPVIYD